jgi:hypothetical protein
MADLAAPVSLLDGIIASVDGTGVAAASLCAPASAPSASMNRPAGNFIGISHVAKLRLPTSNALT